MIGFPSIRGIEKAPSAAEMQSFDRATIEAGVAGAMLMERAGSAVALRLKSLFPDRKQPFLFLCGPGNNGGDGFVAAGKMLRAGYRNVVVLLAESERYSGDLVRERDAYSAQGRPVFLFSESPGKGNGSITRIGSERLGEFLQPGTVLVDSLLGTGQRAGLRGSVRALLEALDSCSERVPTAKVAIDVPTGIDADSGQVFSPHFEADATIAIELIKRGCLQYPARSACGEIYVESIGIDTTADCEFSILMGGVLPLPPERPEDAHKGQAGRILVIGGSLNMPGAPHLAGYAALRTGSGLVTVSQLERAVKAPLFPELILLTLEGQACSLGEQDAGLLQEHAERADCVIIGPGLGREEGARRLVWRLVESLGPKGKPLVIDADGLNSLAGHASGIAAFDLTSAVLTPHPGEAATLLGWETPDVQADRYGAARELFVRSGAAAVVLKGASSIVYGEPGGFINLTGNPFMATAGSGDVLSGIIASLIGQGIPGLEAAKLGVFVHGLAGDRAHGLAGGPIVASDIISSLPLVLWERNAGEIAYC